MPTSRREFLLAAIAWSLVPSTDARASGASDDRAHEIEWHILFVTNQQRVWRKLPPLESSDVLAAIARGHSQDMLARGFFDHRTPEGTGPSDRVARQGLKFDAISENIYSMKNGTSDAAELASIMVTGWMETKGHRRNILDPGFRLVGVGVAATDRIVLATQLFTC